MAHTKESILALLETNDKAVARALVVLYNRQTADEQRTEDTRHSNGIGFTSADAFMGTSMAKQYIKFNSLSNKQVAYWRKRDAKGRMRIGKYWRQLLDAANEKQARKDVLI